MINLFGTKIGMTQIFSESGTLVPITLIQVKSSLVLRIKTKEKDGYNALVMGYQERRKKYLKKPMLDFFSKLKLDFKKYIYEHRFENDTSLLNHKAGDLIDLSSYENIKNIDVRGVSKGKGFQGVIKRHHVHRGPMTHGSDYHRRPGTMGAIGNQRVFPGKKLPGKTGNSNICVQNIEIIKIDLENNLLYVKGAIPGANKQIVKISKAVKSKVKI